MTEKGIFEQLSLDKQNELLGEISFLLFSSKLHKQYRISDIEVYFLAPINLNQFRIYRNKNKEPVGLVTWGCFSEDVEKRYLSRNYRLKKEDWNSGDILWVIDFIAPFGNFENITKDLQENIFVDKIAKSIDIDADGKVLGVKLWKGKNCKKEKKDE